MKEITKNLINLILIKKIQQIALFINGLILLFICSKEFTPRIIYELQGPHNWDSSIYFAVGRGIVNGLIPYKDMFDNKAPGIFLVTALSFWGGG